MKIGDLIIIDGRKYRIIRESSKNFCLNDLEAGGCIGHVAWTMEYLQNYFAERAISFDVENQTIGIYPI